MVEYKQPRDLVTSAKVLGLSVESVKTLIRTGKITAFRIGPRSAVRIPQAELDRHIRESIITDGNI